MLQQARSPRGKGSTQMTHVALNKNRMSHKDLNGITTVYMDDSQEFEIELRNQHDFTTMAKIYLNGKLISSSGLVLRPGESFYLDRYLDEKKKFKFNTYTVDDSPEVKSAIRNNGKVEVYWYREKFDVVPFTRTYDDYTTWYPGTGTVPRTGAPYTTYTSTSVAANTIGGAGMSNMNSSLEAVCSSYPIIPEVETGRVEKGGASDQEFRDVNMTFERHHFRHDIVKILPTSAGPVKTIRSYCECGRRTRSKENFCPQCGRRN